jgi:hypothetical protein
MQKGQEAIEPVFLKEAATSFSIASVSVALIQAYDSLGWR